MPVLLSSQKLLKFRTSRGCGLTGALTSMSGTPLTKNTSAPAATVPLTTTSWRRPPVELGVDARKTGVAGFVRRSEEHTSELQSLAYLVCRLLLEKKKQIK